MASGESGSGLPAWLSMGSVGFAGILGALALSSSGSAPTPTATVAAVVGSQHVPVETKEEPHRVQRMRAPIRDFLGLVPPDEPAQDGGDPKKVPVYLFELPKEKPAKPDPEEAWKVDSELKEQLAKYKLNFLVMTVADPIDSVENYFFDHQIDALLKALAADQHDRWLYCSSYLPWQVFKDRRSVDNKTPLLRQKHWYQDEPGVLVFRKYQEKKETPPELLMVYLVGELPTFGIQRDAMDHAIHEITTLSSLGVLDDAAKTTNKSPIDVRIIGPYFTGGAFSLRESLRHAVDVYPVRPQIITPAASALEKNFFDEKGEHFIGATVCSWHDTFGAINKLVDGHKCAWLVETGTGFSSRFHGRTVGTQLEFIFPVPAGISRVRGGFEKQISAARQQAKGLQPFNSKSPLPFDVDEVARDFPTTQTPLMTIPSVEMVLDQILRTINEQGILFVAIMATDVRDTIFLGEILKLHCPHVQLVIAEADILLTHPEYNDSLRGAIVASSYPMFPSGMMACQADKNLKAMPIMSGQAVYGVYNAVLIHRGLDRGVIVSNGSALSFDPKHEASPPPGLFGLLANQNRISPQIWMHTIGYDRFEPLKVEPESNANYGIVVNKNIDDSSFRMCVNFRAWLPFVILSMLTPFLLVFYAMSLIDPFKAWLHECFRKRDAAGDDVQENELLQPLFQFSSFRPQVRHLVLTLMIGMIALMDIPFAWLAWRLCLNNCPAKNLSWIAETNIFSGVSLLLPLFLSGSAIIFMCYLKLRQSYLVSEKRLKKIVGSENVNDLEPLWWAGGSHVNDPTPIIWLGVIGGLICIWSFFMTWFTTFNTSEKPCLFWTAWGGIVLGYAIWWLAALELYALQRQVRDYAKGLSHAPESELWIRAFEKLHQNDLMGVYRLLFGSGPGNHDPVADSLAKNADCKPVTEGLSFFRNIQYRMVIIKNQFYILLGGAILLFMAVVAYPFTSGGMLNTVSMGTMITFVAAVCLSFWKLETDRDLSKVLGTKPNEIRWDWGTISFFGRNVLLVALVLIVQFVPGTWVWLGKVLAPFSHFGH